MKTDPEITYNVSSGALNSTQSVNKLDCCYYVEMVLIVAGDNGDQRLDTDVDRLLPDLQKYVDEDNERFEAELMAWDCEQRKKTSRASGCGTAQAGAGDVSTTGNDLLLVQSALNANLTLLLGSKTGFQALKCNRRGNYHKSWCP